ncbi:MAG: GNAT family N-acetyltransferase [Anaerolineaceae bacterium]|nr:GNAT family N-acetyltransferase [Anaerolineaceae bacterium]
MKILEYDNVDPFAVLDLNLLCFRFALTPEVAKKIRRLDERAFPFLAIYAVDNGRVVGQTGVFRLPMMTSEGPEDVGGIWAMCTHPAYSRQGIGSLLISEAHNRMREARLRFAALGTSPHWVAHPFYLKHGYQNVTHFAAALAPRALIENCGNAFTVTKATLEALPEADALFRRVALGKTGFARRHEDFLPKMVEIGDEIRLEDLRLLYQGNDLIGYAAVQTSDSLFKVDDILLLDEVDIVAAAAALLSESDAPFVQVTMNRYSSHVARLQQAGFQVTATTLDVVMLSSLESNLDTPAMSPHFGLGTSQFMVSWMDVT